MWSDRKQNTKGQAWLKNLKKKKQVSKKKQKKKSKIFEEGNKALN